MFGMLELKNISDPEALKKSQNAAEKADEKRKEQFYGWLLNIMMTVSKKCEKQLNDLATLLELLNDIKEKINDWKVIMLDGENGDYSGNGNCDINRFMKDYAEMLVDEDKIKTLLKSDPSLNKSFGADFNNLKDQIDKMTDNFSDNGWGKWGPKDKDKYSVQDALRALKAWYEKHKNDPNFNVNGYKNDPDVSNKIWCAGYVFLQQFRWHHGGEKTEQLFDEVIGNLTASEGYFTGEIQAQQTKVQLKMSDVFQVNQSGNTILQVLGQADSNTVSHIKG